MGQCGTKRDQVTDKTLSQVRSPAFSGIFILHLSSVYYHLSSVYHLLVGIDDKNDDKLMIYDDKLMITDDK